MKRFHNNNGLKSQQPQGSGKALKLPTSEPNMIFSFFFVEQGITQAVFLTQYITFNLVYDSNTRTFV